MKSASIKLVMQTVRHLLSLFTFLVKISIKEDKSNGCSAHTWGFVLLVENNRARSIFSSPLSHSISEESCSTGKYAKGLFNFLATRGNRARNR